MLLKELLTKIFRSHKNLIVIISISIIDLIFIYIFKYAYNNIGISEFSLNKFGNKLNLFLTAVLVLPFLFISLKKNIPSSFIQIILYLSGLYLIIDLTTFFIALINPPFPISYLFGYPFKKIFIVSMLTVSQIIRIYIIFLIWQMLLGTKVSLYLKAFRNTVILVVSFIILTYINNLYYSPLNPDKLENEKYDVAVILGAAVWQKDKPSPIFRGRIEKAFELLKKGIVKKIQVTGGNAPGEISEAKAAFNYLIEKYNIDKSLVFIEEETSTTSEQVQFIKRDLVEKKGMNNILIISDKFHLRRVLEMCDFFNTNAYGISSDYELNWKELFLYRFRDSIGVLIFWLFAV